MKIARYLFLLSSKSKRFRIFIGFIFVFLLFTIYVIKNDSNIRKKRSRFKVNSLDDNPEFECNVNKLNEWDPMIKNLFSKTPKYDKCVKNEPLTYLIENNLFINQTVNNTFYNGSITHCEYATVIRNTVEKDDFSLGDFKEFESPMIVIDDFFKVRCLKNKTVHYEYVHSVIQKKKLHDYYKDFRSEFVGDSKINIMIFVLDAVSLSSFKRALPKTHEYLRSFENFFLFEKHHVVGENTFQNIVPMLSNLNPDLVFKKTKITKNKRNSLEMPEPFDDVPFLWKNFSYQ